MADPADGELLSGSGRDGVSVVVVGVDGSDTSWRAVAYAVGFVRRQRSRSRLVFVYVTANPGLSAFVPQVVPAARDAEAEIANEIKERIEAGVAPLDVDWAFRTGQGRAFSELKRIAVEVHADAVVVGASTRIGHRLAGSLAVQLVKSRLWPVIVVP